MARSLLDRWLARYAKPSPEALAAVAGLTPAVVVTGGSSGIGLEIARLFHADGATVLLIGRGQDRLVAACATFADPARIHTLALDVADADAPARIDATLEGLGLYLDILVNSAALGMSGMLYTHAPSDIENLINVNVLALTRLTRHALGGMVARARGGIINVSSLGGYVPGAYQTAYYASKAYVCSFTEALAEELTGFSVRVTVVAPGPVETPFHADMGAERAFYRLLIPALSPERTAREAVNAFRWGRAVSIPGVVPKLLSLLVHVLPHWMTVPVVGGLLWPRP
jgi:short-subunit dehydrogenase